MRRNIILILTLLLVSGDVFGKNGNKPKQIITVHKSYGSNKPKVNSVRVKRSLGDETEKILMVAKENLIDDSNQYDYLDGIEKDFKPKSSVEKESPFWGNRGRRDSSSDETVPDVQLPTPKLNKHNKNLYKLLNDKLKDELPSFWDRGGRGSDDVDDPPQDLFWANRGRRQDGDPFWGTRGRRQEDDLPFWGNRGRRENLVSSHVSNKDSFDDDEPFWGNRGRRQEQEPFWGNRGRREPSEIYSSDGTNKAKSHYSYKNLLNKKQKLKNAIIDTIEELLSKNVNFERNIRKDTHAGRDSEFRTLFNVLARNYMQYKPNNFNDLSSPIQHSNRFQQNTVHDDRIYAEEPHYILVERSSRSSAEDDPFFISRGKKYRKPNLAKAVRGRRGALEDIMKSVRNDPYNIARGKKNYVQIGSSNTTESQFIKTKDLICASLDLLTIKHSEGNKAKREVHDNDRDRRTTLKKLALQLQMDPYFVSRGKKGGGDGIKLDDLEEFVNKVIVLCN